MPAVPLNVAAALEEHQAALRECRRCPDMIAPVVTGPPVRSRVYVVGQAPGPREGALGRPFAWTAGKTLFSWFARVGLTEDEVRARVHFAAVCRCFPGKAKGGGDRVPSAVEIEACSGWIATELALLDPELVIPVGRLAIGRFLPPGPLEQIVGRLHRVEVAGRARAVLPLPHPSGASTWFRTEPGKSRLEDALALLGEHPEWRAIRE